MVTKLKSTLTLLFALQRAGLYPNQKIVVVAPTKGQSSNFIKKVREFMRESPNLSAEIKDVKVGQNQSSILFHNGSEIITVPYNENALGIRCNILIVDEFVRTDKEVIQRVFVPFLTSIRTPAYRDLTKEEREKIPDEANRQLYLSSIRGADEWSFAYFLEYLDTLLKGKDTHIAIALPYHFGVKNKFISKAIVEQSFKDNTESMSMVLAEFLCIPERSNGNAFYKYRSLEKRRDNARCMVSMSDEEYIEYKDNKSKFPYYQEKLPNEIRLLCMDIALVESQNNDNTAFWILRLIPDGGSYKILASYAESIHGQNSILQALRLKQLFYEFDCDYAVIDGQGVGVGVLDICSAETYDKDRDVMYPAWMPINIDETKTNRAISPNAVPVIYSISTSIKDKSRMLVHSRDIIDTDRISFLMDTQDVMDYLNRNYQFYKIEDQDLRRRILNPYAQTSAFVNEAVNLEKVVVQGYLSAKEKSGRRKDRVMSLVYGLEYAKILEDGLIQPQEINLFDYILTG